MTAASSIFASPVAHLGDQGVISLFKVYDVGSTGAITVKGGSAQVALTRTDVGTYTGTFPTGAAMAVVTPLLVKTSTVVNCLVEAIDAAAGTFSLQMRDIQGDPGAEADCEAASGDIIGVRVDLFKATF